MSSVACCKPWLNLARRVDRASAHRVRPFVGSGLARVLSAREKWFPFADYFWLTAKTFNFSLVIFYNSTGKNIN